MVHESSSDPDIQVEAIRNNSTQKVFVHNGRSRSQTGFRSREITLEEERGIRSASIAGNVDSLIGFYDQVGYEFHGKHQRAFVCNDRDYTETKYQPSQFALNVAFRNPGTGVVTPYNIKGNWAIRSFNSGTFFPSVPSGGSISLMAAEMMRQSVPLAPTVNLYRFIGEQRDLPGMFKRASYLPKTIPEGGGAYLNWVFGVKPELSDILNMAEKVMLSDKKVRQVLDHERVRKKTNKGRLLFEDAGVSWFQNKFATQAQFNQSITFFGALTQFSYLTVSGSGSSTNSLIPNVSLGYTAKQRLRQFATWEYFVPRPKEIHNRLDQYKKLASELLGEGGTLGTAYDLTPYSWLLNWFVDVGGLIHYQQTVHDNQIVATNNGYTLSESLEITAKVHEPLVDYTGVTSPWPVVSLGFTDASSKLSWRRETRRGGSPYNILPSWDGFSNQQWAILGALGLSRSGGVGIKR
jgi:hypothetical protein